MLDADADAACPASRSPGATRCAASPRATSTATAGSSSSSAPPATSRRTDQTDIVTRVPRATAASQPGFPPNTTGAVGLRRRLLRTPASTRTSRSADRRTAAATTSSRPRTTPTSRSTTAPGVAFDANPIFEDRTKFLGRPLHARLRRGPAGLRRRRGAPDCRRTSRTPRRRSPTSTATAQTRSSCSARCRTPRRPIASAASRCGSSTATARARPPGTTPFHVPGLPGGPRGSGRQHRRADQPGLGRGPRSRRRRAWSSCSPASTAASTPSTPTRQERWAYTYTTDATVLTGGVAIADLSGDGVPEIVFATYSTRGRQVGALHPRRRRQPSSTRSRCRPRRDAGADDRRRRRRRHARDRGRRSRTAAPPAAPSLVFTVPGSATNCLLWPTGRANLLRNGYVRRP